MTMCKCLRKECTFDILLIRDAGGECQSSEGEWSSFNSSVGQMFRVRVGNENVSSVNVLCSDVNDLPRNSVNPIIGSRNLQTVFRSEVL